MDKSEKCAQREDHRAEPPEPKQLQSRILNSQKPQIGANNKWSVKNIKDLAISVNILNSISIFWHCLRLGISQTGKDETSKSELLSVGS